MLHRIVRFLASTLVLAALCSASASSLYESQLESSYQSAGVLQSSPDDAYVEALFVRYAASLGKATFNDVKQSLDDLDCDYSSEIGENTLATFHVQCPEGKLYFCFYPLDMSETSTAFGDPDREMLSCIEYSRGDRWITITDEFHVTPTSLIIGDRSADPVKNEVSDVSYLLMYYNLRIGGNVSLGGSPVIETPDARESSVRSVVSRRIKNYTKTTIESISANQDLSTSEPDDFIIIVNLQWDVKNGADRTRTMLEMYGDDLAAALAKEFYGATTILVIWDVPYLNDKGPIAKFEYYGNNGTAYIVDKTGPLYQ